MQPAKMRCNSSTTCGAIDDWPDAPCEPRSECDEWLKDCASTSWFVSSRWHGGPSSTEITLALARRLTGADGDHPCVTYDQTHPHIKAVVLVLPHLGMHWKSNFTSAIYPRECVAPAQKVVQDLKRRFNAAANAVPRARRFVYSLAECFTLHLNIRWRKELAQASTLDCLIDWRGYNEGGRLSELPDLHGATVITRGTNVRYDDLKWPGIASIVGWPLGVDTGFTPSQKCLSRWIPLMQKRRRAFLLGNNAGVHGVVPCLRKLLSRACSQLAQSKKERNGQRLALCQGNVRTLGQFVPTRAAGLTGLGKNLRVRDHMAHQFWGSVTFGLMSAGDELDRGAALQCLNVGCIPVFFGGNSKGELQQQAYSSILFGTQDPRRWSTHPATYQTYHTTGIQGSTRCSLCR